ncbi:MAG: nucleotide sugar dehydrogenase [Alphaproteobacteria bacterium]|nr:nucleotide sugar dehydrogenase [Alphaproteobacteria bacterium]
MSPSPRIAVIGLGYVGLPLALALARPFDVVGFDIDRGRVNELAEGHDRTNEVTRGALDSTRLQLTADDAEIAGADIFIITVPTPVDDDHLPDLGAVRAACRTVGRRLRAGAIVVLESTVYPGVTEEVCGPLLADASGLRCGVDFFLGYSPERMNPGDKVHTVDKITKVVSGQTPAVAQKLGMVYGAVNGSDVFVAASIKTAEAAKIIENAQRDINIAFINEVTMIFERLGISVFEVLDASATKWNFLPFRPGLVGGHCIGVDPYYLAHKAVQVGHQPEVILAGRRINDGMGEYVADRLHQALGQDKGRVLVLGLTFKENVPDLRNAKVVDVIKGLQQRGHTVDVHDPLADPAEALREYTIALQGPLTTLGGYDCVLGAVAHEPYRAFAAADLARLVTANGLVADLQGMWRRLALPSGLRRWQP